MTSFIHNKKEIEFHEVTGEVLGQNKFSETHVSSSGGGGYVGKTGGYVGAANISSEAVTNHEFWIKKDDGTEESVQLLGHDIPLREGQTISMIYAANKGGDTSYPCALINHNAKRSWKIVQAQSLNTVLAIDKASPMGLLQSLVVGWLAWIFTDSLGAGAMAAFAFFIVYIVRTMSRVNKMLKALDNHIDHLASSFVSSLG